jgi:hypothetical protein
VPGIFDDALRDLSEPFHAIVHTLSSNPLDEADCLPRFINFETERTTTFLRSVHEVASAVRRVVIVTSLSPFAQWLIDPHVDKGSGRAASSQSHLVVDFDNILATSQASNNIVNDAVMTWMKDSGVSFEVTYITAPSVYGPAVHPLETSSDLSETSRRIWNICSSEPQERTETPPYGITHFADVRVRLPLSNTDSTKANLLQKDVADASIRAIFIDRAASKRFVISAGIMPSGLEIAQYLVARFPELNSRIRMDGSPPRPRQTEDPSLDFLDRYLMTTILDIQQLRSAETTLTDTVRQILDLQKRKAWKSITQ